MQNQAFKAYAQYGDWDGTANADGADQRGLYKWLEKNGHAKEGEFLLGMRMSAGESHGVHTDPVHVEFLFAQPGDHDNVKAMIDASNGPVLVRQVLVSMSLLEFFSLFKRFSVAFSADGMLSGRDYSFLDY